MKNILIGILFLATSCIVQKSKPEEAVASMPKPSLAKQTTEKKDPLSYGSVTSVVKKGVTTQLEILEIFGGPNISSTDENGDEVWVYERSKTESNSSYSEEDESAVEVTKLYNYFNPSIEVDGKVRNSKSGNRSNSVTFRSLTVIVKFDSKKIVKTFSVRSSQF